MSKKTQSAKYVIGIDLGTTNSGAAYAEIRPDADLFAPANVELLAIPQLTNPGEVRDEDLLPSFLYLPGATDFPAGSLALPWDEAREYAVGRLAQKRGVENAGRLVSSAKSWLSHSAVDRTSPLLAVPRTGRRGEDLAGGCRAAGTWSTYGRPGTPRCRTRRSRRSMCW